MKIKTIPAEAAEPIATLFLEPFLKSLIKKEDGTYFSKELNRSYKINDKGELIITLTDGSTVKRPLRKRLSLESIEIPYSTS